MISSKESVKDAGMIAGAAALDCCKPVFGETSFYGPTIRDRLWMWGHHSEMCHHSVKKGSQWPGKTIEQAEGCRLMGIPNNCVIRWGNMPKHPWGNYFDQFKGMKRISFGITDGATGSVWDKMKIAFDELQPAMPNLTGCFLDDFFVSDHLNQTVDDLRKISDEVHAHNLRLSVVLYSDQDGFKPEFKSKLDLCDETSLWFWKSSNIATMADNVKRCREFIGPEKDLLLGLYMWDFTLAAPVPAERMELQLDYARKFLAERTVTGLIFHPTFSAALDVPSVKLSKEWIAAHGESRWGA